MKPDQIVRPRTLEEASAWVEKLGDSAGLLWLGPRVEPPESWARESMIDLSELELDYIKAGDNEVAIGGGTAIQSLVEDEPLQAAFGGLIGAAARRLAHYGMRNLASVGGAVGTREGPPELVLALLGLGAELVVMPGDKTVPIEAFRSGIDASSPAFIRELRIPRRPAGPKGWGLEWLARSPMDEALAAACAVVEIEGDQVTWARLAVAGAGWAPSLIADAESQLMAAKPVDRDPASIIPAVTGSVNPVADFRASAGYQTDMMGRLAARAVSAAFNKAGAR